MSMVNEANEIAGELRKKVRFSVKMVAEQGAGEEVEVSGVCGIATRRGHRLTRRA